MTTRKKTIHCNNGNCTSRELCQYGGMWFYGCKIIYGQGQNHNECQDFMPKHMYIDQLLIDSDGIGAP